MKKNAGVKIAIVVIIVVVLLGVTARYYRTKHQNTTKTTTTAGVVLPGNYEDTLSVDGKTRSYKIHVPETYNGKTATPVVVYFHGGGGSSDSAEKDGLFAYADKYGFILVAPAGSGILGDKGLTWNAGSWSTAAGGGSCCGYAVEHNINDTHFVTQLISNIENKFNVDKTRVYATGISNGAEMSLKMGCELPNTFAAIAPVASPGVPEPCSPARPVPMMYIHGTSDPCAPFLGGKGGGCIGNQTFDAQSAETVVDTWRSIIDNVSSQKTGYQKGKTSCIDYAGVSTAQDVTFCTITDGGHTYPNGNQYLPTSRVGSVSHDISFDQIWEFFKNHQL